MNYLEKNHLALNPIINYGSLTSKKKETTNFIIRPITLADVPTLFAWISTQKIRLLPDFPRTLANFEDYETTNQYVSTLQKKMKNRETYVYVMEDTEQKSVIGLLYVINIDWRIPKCDIAYFIHGAAEGKGLMTKAVDTLLKICFLELAMKRVTARIAPTNVGSQKVVLKNGFRREGVLRNSFRTGADVVRDEIYFGILEEEFLGSRE